MTDTVSEKPQSIEIQEEPAEEMDSNYACQQQDESRSPSSNFREAGYVVLFIAAVFVINAMETGSYRTPWPVAIVTLLAGLSLYGYSWYLQSRTKTS